MLEDLRKVLRDDRLLLEVGLITAMEVETDRSALRVMVSLVPDEIEIVATMSWDLVGPESGIFQFPVVNDMVLVSFVDGHEDGAFVLRRLTSQEDKIPLAAVDGHLVVRSLAGKKAFLVSDTEINLVKGDTPGTEKAVLGTTFQEAYSKHLETDIKHTHIGNLGYATAPPTEAPDYTAIKAAPVDDKAMLSDLVKLEK